VDRERLETLNGRLMAVGGDDLDVAVIVRHGVPAAEILALLEQASLVVMGTHGRGFVSELFVGSVSHNVARHAGCPVLLIPLSQT
jgi:nucleotide-binding universal stress UspA family protein